MNNKLIEIYNHFGYRSQLKKILEEVGELLEAITTYELKKSVEYEIPLTEIIGTKEHIEEEFADVLVLLNQIKEYYDLNEAQIIINEQDKINRTIERIESGYYAKK